MASNWKKGHLMTVNSVDWKKGLLTESFNSHQTAAANKSTDKYKISQKLKSIQDPRPLQSALSLPLPSE